MKKNELKIKSLQGLDQYLGSFLCFILTIFDGCRAWFAKALENQKKRTDTLNILPEEHRILFFQLSEMGSIVLAQKAFSTAEKQGSIYIASFLSSAEVFNLVPHFPISNRFFFNTRTPIHFLLSTLQFIIWSRKKKITITIDLELFSRISVILSYLSGAKSRVGFVSQQKSKPYRGDLLTKTVTFNDRMHISENFNLLSLTAFQGLTDPDFAKSGKGETNTLESTGSIRPRHVENTLLVYPLAGNFLPQRMWPSENFIELILLILNRYPNLKVRLIGSQDEYFENEKIRLRINHQNCDNLSGKISLLELKSLFDRSIALIANDSGISHFASLTNIKSFVFYGPETPQLYGTLGNSEHFYSQIFCSPCVSALNYKRTTCQDNQCLKVIRAQDVFKKVVTYLDSIYEISFASD